MDLKRRGRFLETDAGRRLKDEAAMLGSPVIEFVHDQCEFMRTAVISKQKLYDAYVKWSGEARRGVCGRTKFYRDIRNNFKDKVKEKQVRHDDGREWSYAGIQLNADIEAPRSLLD